MKKPVPRLWKRGVMFQAHFEDCVKKIEAAHTLRSRISFWRLLSSIAAVLLFCFGYTQKSMGCFLLSVAVAVGFVLLVSYDHKILSQLTYLTGRKSVIEDYYARMDDGWKQFPLCGPADPHGADATSGDLDIFGKHSLYQYLCTASTTFGQDQLARLLIRPDQQPVRIRERQKAVTELSQKTDFTLHFEASARNLREISYDASKKALDDLFHALQEDNRASLAERILIWVVPALTLGFLCCYLSGMEQEWALLCFSGSAMLQLCAAFFGHWRNSRLLAPVYKINRTVTPYRRLIAQLMQESFQSPDLQKLQQSLSTEALHAFGQLEAITESVVVRHNVYASLFLNSLFCYDFHCVRRYCKWKSAYRDTFRVWLEAVGTVEALISLGVPVRTRQTCTMPVILDTDRPSISADCLQHPLIRETDAVGNDFHLTHQTCVITGSNMSGKTTFMRSIGTNLILAYAGGFCTARGLRVSCMEICTSMRVADSVSEGISSFYAEILQIKNILETSRKGQPMISLIDEIYRGTNSRDRIYAARETVKNLAKPYVVTILTTHDMELCDLEQEPGMDVENYYFSEHYDKDRILFDYKIRKGRCTSANARHLLRMAGIL